MTRLGLERTMIDAEVYQRTVHRFRDGGILLPTIGQLKNPLDFLPPANRTATPRLSSQAPNDRQTRNRLSRPTQEITRARRCQALDRPWRIAADRNVPGIRCIFRDRSHTCPGAC